MSSILQIPIAYRKARFFSSKFVTYFSVLLLPIWLPQSVEMNFFAQASLISIYTLFLAAQWYLLAKEVDNRLKIYLKTNSSLERVLYRMVLGASLIAIYFNILSLLPPAWIRNFYWGTWCAMGLFYSWPTRGKIIEETISSDFSEFRFLDGFERLTLALIIGTFILTFPKLTFFDNYEALILYFDPKGVVSDVFWNFLWISNVPFHGYSRLLNIAFYTQIYFYGLGIFLLTSYVLFRYLFSRRIAMLGCYSIISSWSISKLIGADFLVLLWTSISLLWLWAMLWSSRCSSYRIGFFLGVIPFWGGLFDVHYTLLWPITAGLVYFVIFKNNSVWFRQRLLKHMMFGLAISCILSAESVRWDVIFSGYKNRDYFGYWVQCLSQKSFFLIAPMSLVLIALSWIFPSKGPDFLLIQRSKRVRDLGIVFFTLLCFAFAIELRSLSGLVIFWIVALFSLIPLEGIFQIIHSSRSSKNVIYVFYMLACLLDSHMEGRLKILLQNLN